MTDLSPAANPFLDPVRVRLEYSTEAAFIADVPGNLTWVAPSVANILGRSPEELVGLRLRDLVEPAFAARALELREQLMRSGPDDPEVRTEPICFATGTGRSVWCTVTARLVFSDEGDPVGIAGALRDVDDLVRSRDRAAEASLLLHEALDAQEDPWVTARAVRDAAGRIVDFEFEEVNRAAAAFHERDVDSIVGHTLSEVYGEKEAATDIRAGSDVLATGSALVLNDQFSTVAQAHGRPPTWLDVRVTPIGTDRILYTWRVVTSRYEAVARQAEAFQLLRAVMDAQIEPHAILRAVRGDDGEITDFAYEDCNEAAADFEHSTLSALIGQTLRSVSPSPADADIDISDCREVLRTGVPAVQNDVVTAYLRPDGRPIVIDGRIVPIDEDRVSYSWRDVTDRYDDQRRRADSEERFRLLAGASSDVVYLAGMDGRITWVAPTITRSLGWAPSDWIGRLPGEFLHPDDLARLAGTKSNPTDQDETTTDDAQRIRGRDGSYRWMTMRREALYDNEHRLIGVSGALRDVDQLVRARLAIAEAHDTLRKVMDNQVDPHSLAEAVRDERGEIVTFRIVDANPAAARYEGLARHDLIGRTYGEFYSSPDEARLDVEYCRAVVESGQPLELNDEVTDKTDERGRQIVVDVRIVSLGGDRVSYQWRDVTDRYESAQALITSEERFRVLAENVSDVVVLVRNGITEWASPSAERVLGWRPDELVGKPAVEFVHPEDVHAATADWQAVSQGPLPRVRFRMLEKSGSWHWVEISGSVMTGPAGRTVVLGARVVDAEVAAQQELEHMAHHDELTGLVNRHAVFEQLTRTLGGEARSGRELGVLFFDLDGFKGINDSVGHTAGDVVLRVVADRVQQLVRGGDVVARIGGDEFLVVLNGLRTVDDALSIAEKVREAVRRPIELDGDVAQVSASIGVCMAAPGQSVDDLVAHADRAMYAAKRQGKNAVVLAAGELDD